MKNVTLFDIYSSDDENGLRFTLGQKGEKILLVIGVNPSTADKEKSDMTISRVKKFTSLYAYDGFIMVNLYPKRATFPKDLPLTIDGELHLKNLMAIERAITESDAVLCAWGNTIKVRKYLNKCYADVANLLNKYGLPCYCLGLTNEGYPRHPSRVKTPDRLIEFAL